MTISSEVRKTEPFIGNDVTTDLPFEFKVFSAEDMLVVRANAAGDETILVLDTDYTVTLNANQNDNPGGTVTLSAPLTTGFTAVVSSDLENLQPTDLTNQGGFYPSVVTSALDRLTILVQQVAEGLGRAVKTKITDSRTGDELLADIFEAEGNAAASAAAAEESANRVDLGALDQAVADAQTAELGAQTAQGLAEGARDAAQLAETNADQSEVNAEIAEDGANLAKIAAEAAAVASLAASNTYADVASGEAATVDGDVFLVITSDPQIYEVYDNQSGTGVLLGNLNIADSTTFNNAVLSRGSMVQSDTNGRVAAFVRRTGVVRARNLIAARVNGLDLGAVARGVISGGGTFGFDTLFLDNTGQSLGQASVGGAPITRTQEGNGFAYPYGVAAPSPSAFLPAISTDANVMGLNAGNLPTPENPMFGMIGFLRELLARENGVLDTDANIRIGTANNARGSAPLVNFDRALTGTGSYALWYQQAVAAKSYADSNGERLFCPASHLIQGEADFDRVDAFTYWYNKALQQAQDRASDMAALGIAGPIGHRYLIYQMCQRPPGLGDYGVTRAQYELAKDYPDLLTLTAPNYFFNFTGDTTGVHIMTEDAKWLGGYAALAIKRLLIDRVAWGVPVATPVVIGDSIILEYSGVRQAPFVIDTDTIPAQPNFGWKVYDELGVEVTVSSVSLAGPTGIRLNCAATPGTGWRIRYAQSPTTNRTDNFVGGCGNIRDSHGNNCIYEAINKPMHNWLPAHDVTLA